MQDALALWLQVSKALQLRFSHSIQDVYNQIGVVLANREDGVEAIPYLTKAVEIYTRSITACKLPDPATVFEGVTINALDKYLLKKDPEATVERIVHGGIELNVIEAGYTQTLFYMA